MADLTYDQRLKMLKMALGICDECWPDFVKFAGERGSGDIFVKIRDIVWDWWGEWPHGNGCPVKPSRPKEPSALASDQVRATIEGSEQPPSLDPSKIGREVTVNDQTPQS